MTRAVLVIDMLRGFLEAGYPLYAGASARRVIPHVRERLETEIKQGAAVFFVGDCHATDDPEFAMFPSHCITGTPEAEIIPELAGIRGEVIPKQHFSAFFETTLEEELKRLAVDELVVCGVLTDICILHTVADARQRGYQVEVPVDCVAAIDDARRDFALEHLNKVLGAVITGTRRDEIFAPSPAVVDGETADVYFRRTLDILEKEHLNPVATMEVFPGRDGIICGIEEVKSLLGRVLPEKAEVWTLDEGDAMQSKEVVLRITAPYRDYGLYETAICGILAHASGWATAARQCVSAARGRPVISFGARHVHPAVAGVMDYAAVVGGCAGCSSIIGARLCGLEPSGTMPHALIIIIGDTAEATLAFDKHMPSDLPRISLVDTFRDEAEESLRVARALGEHLDGVRLDTPRELGGVTIEMVREIRARLDAAGFAKVRIVVSGGITLERINHFLESNAPVDSFGVGSYISDASPIDFTADLHEVDGQPIAKRGRIPGITPNSRLKRVR